MNSLNSIMIEGDLEADPVKENDPSGLVRTKFVLISHRFYNATENNVVVRKEELSRFEVEAYNKTAELAFRSLRKGSGVRCVGRLKQVSWYDNDGKAHSRVTVIAETIEFKPKFDTKGV